MRNALPDETQFLTSKLKGPFWRLLENI